MTSTTTNSGTASRVSGDIGVGLISVGWMGKLHSRAYQALPWVYPELGLRPRLVHAADTAADRVAYARDILGYAKGSSDYRDVLADPGVEVVSICAPNVLHHEIGLAAAEAGKPFWIEKPVGRDARETAQVAAAARKAGIATSIGYNYRHAPAVEHVRELVAQGALGDLLSHVVDLVSYLVGPIAEVSALTSTVYAERPILPMGSATHFAVIEDGELGPVDNEDYAATLVRFAPSSRGPGAVGTLEASRTIVGPQCGLGFELYGTDGSAVWNFEQMNELRVCLGPVAPT